MSSDRQEICCALMSQMVIRLQERFLVVADWYNAVDICITTPLRALERVCLLAKTLAERTLSQRLFLDRFNDI